MRLSYIDFHTHRLPTEEDITAIYNVFHYEQPPSYPYYSIGIHPWHTERLSENEWENFVQYIPGALAIGECGMDKAPRFRSSFDKQKEIFIRQIRLSETYKKPLIIHCVRCYNTLKQLRRSSSMPWIIHGFNKSYELAIELMEKYGMFLSFGQALLNNNGKIPHIFKKLPLSRILLETDDKPVNIKNIYRTAAQIKEITEQTLLIHMHKQFEKIFKKSVFSQ